MKSFVLSTRCVFRMFQNENKNRDRKSETKQLANGPPPDGNKLQTPSFGATKTFLFESSILTVPNSGVWDPAHSGANTKPTRNVQCVSGLVRNFGQLPL